jgi:TolB protein
MEPTARFHTLRFLLTVCLALMVAQFLTADGRATPLAPFPTALTYVDSAGNITLSTDLTIAPTTLTDDWKGDAYPAWSPNGQQLVFARFYAGGLVELKRELFRLNADGSGLQRLTDNDLFESWPTWSPDGARLAFAAGDLYVMPSAGGAPLKLTTGTLNPQHLTWSPNGTRLAFNSWPCPGQEACAAAELYVITVPDGQLTRLTHNDLYDGDPAWSPDGTRLVYETGPAGSTDLYLIPAAGGTPTPLMTTAAGTDPAWSPDGAFIAYAQEEPAGSYSYHLAIIRPDGTDKRQLTDNGEEILDPTWPADSQSITFFPQITPCGMACGEPTHYVVKADLEPGGEVELLGAVPTSLETTTYSLSIATNRLLFADGGVIHTMDVSAWPGQDQLLTGPVLLNGDPARSPDGRRLAFSSQRDFNYNIHIMDADGGNRAALTTHPGNDWNPTWSAHDRIAFNTNRDGNWELYVMVVGDSPDADGSGQTNLTHTAEAEADPAWSPDGHRLAFARQTNGNWDIYVMNEDGSNVVRLTTHPAADRYPTWSPDGRLAFQTDRDGNDEIYVLSLSGAPGSEANLTHSAGDEREPAWSPDGTKIAYSHDALPTDNGLYLMNADGSGRQFLYDALSPQPAWQPAPPNLTPRIWVPLVNR